MKRTAYRRNTANLLALVAIQGANALLSLVAYPLILSVVGPAAYSRIVVTEAVALVVLTLVIYSFDIEGVSRIADLDTKEDPARIATLFFDILFGRLMIIAGCAVLFLLLSPFLDRTTFIMLGSWLLFPLAYVFQSAWFFQGLERNIAHAIVIVFSRFTCLALIKLQIKEPGDFMRVPLIIGGSYAAGGLSLTLYAILRYKLRLTRASPARLRELIWNGKEIFLGNLSVGLYRDSNVLILNAMSTEKTVAVYSIAEKAVKVFQAGARPLNQVFFPKLIRALNGKTGPDKTTLRIILHYTIPQLLLLLLALVCAIGGSIIFKERMPGLFYDPESNEIVTLIAIMIVAVFFGVANFMFGSGGLNFLGRRAQFARAILLTGICSLTVCAILINLYAARGAAFGFVAAEVLLFVLILRVYYQPADSRQTVKRV